MAWCWYLAAFMIFILLGLILWRESDARADRQAWTRLTELGASNNKMYIPDLVVDLPEPAQRYFNYVIRPGTPLTRIVEIEMGGELGMGTKTKPNYQPMQARQILVPPYGLVWKVKAGPIAGSDGAMPDTSWTRFWLFGLAPVVRAAGLDHRRSAFGRVVAEAAFWAPASLLPDEYVRWELMDANSARAIVTYGDFSQAVAITVDVSGAPTQVIIQRWSNENPDKNFREQPFGGYLSEFRDFGGYRLPTRVEGGNLIGTSDYFPFFKAVVTDIRFAERLNR